MCELNMLSPPSPGHSIWKVGYIRLLSLPYLSLIRKIYPFTALLTEIVFQSPACGTTIRSCDLLHRNRASLTTRSGKKDLIFHVNPLLGR